MSNVAYGSTSKSQNTTADYQSVRVGWLTTYCTPPKEYTPFRSVYGESKLRKPLIEGRAVQVQGGTREHILNCETYGSLDYHKFSISRSILQQGVQTMRTDTRYTPLISDIDGSIVPPYFVITNEQLTGLSALAAEEMWHRAFFGW